MLIIHPTFGSFQCSRRFFSKFCKYPPGSNVVFEYGSNPFSLIPSKCKYTNCISVSFGHVTGAPWGLYLASSPVILGIQTHMFPLWSRHRLIKPYGPTLTWLAHFLGDFELWGISYWEQLLPLGAGDSDLFPYLDLHGAKKQITAFSTETEDAQTDIVSILEFNTRFSCGAFVLGWPSLPAVLLWAPCCYWTLPVAPGSAEPEEVVHVHPRVSHCRAPYRPARVQCGSVPLCQLPSVTGESTKEDIKRPDSCICVFGSYSICWHKIFTEAQSHSAVFNYSTGISWSASPLTVWKSGKLNWLMEIIISKYQHWIEGKCVLTFKVSLMMNMHRLSMECISWYFSFLILRNWSWIKVLDITGCSQCKLWCLLRC